jgi:hypothetical protein
MQLIRQIHYTGNEHPRRAPRHLAIAQSKSRDGGCQGANRSDDTPAGFCQCCISIVAGVTTRHAPHAADQLCSCLRLSSVYCGRHEVVIYVLKRGNGRLNSEFGAAS